MDLGERIGPSSASILRETVYNVEGLNDARTARVGFFNSLLARPSAVKYKSHRSVVHQLDLHVRRKNSGFHMSPLVL